MEAQTIRKITKLIVHCSATGPDWFAGKSVQDKTDEIRRWHVEGNGWGGIGYHYIIDRDGSVAVGLPESEIGRHVGGVNRESIGICLIGGLHSSATDQFGDHFTEAQSITLRHLLSDLQSRYINPTIHGHNEFNSSKACPGFQVQDWWRREQQLSPEMPVVRVWKRTVARVRAWWGRRHGE